MPPEPVLPGSAADWLRHARSDLALAKTSSTARYPGETEPLTEEEYREALGLAEGVVTWAADCVSSP